MKIFIEGMSCAHCQAAVTEALAAVSGISAVSEVSLSGKYAAVEGSAPAAVIREAIEDIGFDFVRIENE